MKHETEFEDETEVADVPVSALLSAELKNRYGSVPDLDDEELADPEELERQVYMDYFGPILRLPAKRKSAGFFPAVDESGGVDWGAFGTVDFSRTMPEFDKARYKADKLRERLEDLFIMIGIVKERVPAKARGPVLRYLRKGVISLDHITNEDMRGLGRLYLKALRLQKEIAQLREASRNKRQAKLAKVFAE
jgi:hypothetical protein